MDTMADPVHLCISYRHQQLDSTLAEAQANPAYDDLHRLAQDFSTRLGFDTIF